MASTVRMVATDGPLKGAEFRFQTYGVLLFGRAPDCHARLPAQDLTASRHHFMLEVNPPIVRLRDLGSLGGTYVNGRKCGGRAVHESAEAAAHREHPQIDLHDGDEIRVGQSVLRLEIRRDVACARCGAVVSLPERAPGPGPQGSFLCPTCQRTAPPAVAAVASPSRCAECGRPVSPRQSQDEPESLLCSSCRELAQDDPHSLLMKLIRRLAGAGRRGSAREIQEIAGHEIERQLGRGGFGAVYLVRDRQTGERMALKIMLAQALVDENARKRFLREIETMRLLRHPHIVRLRTSGAVGDFFYFTMEYCPGGSLAAYMQQRGRRPLREAGPIMLEALDGLAAAHAAGIVHRDVKPANLLLAGPSAPWITKVGDLGLSRKFTEAGFSGLTATGTRGGDLLYMPREQLLHFHQVRPASDVWAAGATFYILLTGRHPRQTPPGQRLDPLRLVLEGETVPIRQVEPGLPEGVADVLDRALHPEPEARYQSAGEMRRALAAALA